MELTSGNEQVKVNQPDTHDATGHARRCIKSTVRTVVVSLDIRWLDLMPKHAFFYPSRSNVCKGHFPWMSLHLQVSQLERVYFSLKSSFDISRASGFLGEWPSSLRPLSLGIKHIVKHHRALDNIWHITVPEDPL